MLKLMEMRISNNTALLSERGISASRHVNLDLLSIFPNIAHRRFSDPKIVSNYPLRPSLPYLCDDVKLLFKGHHATLSF